MDNSSDNKQNGVDADQPVRSRLRLGSVQLRSSSSVRDVVALGDPGQAVDSAALDAILGEWSLTGHLDTGRAGSRSRSRAASTTRARAPAASSPIRSAIRTCPAIAPTARRCAQWFNTSAFTVNALGTFGNAGRNSLRGRDYPDTWTSGFRRRSDHGPRCRTQFRLEAFNALNNVNFGLPVSAQNNGNFGRILSADSPRILQLALRLMF